VRKLNLCSLNRQARAARAGDAFVPGCTGKPAYDTGAEANEVVRRRKEAGAKRLSSYQCKNCHLFHITSHPRSKK
jgi:hypothetical protein